jgi:hypothetical protein
MANIDFHEGMRRLGILLGTLGTCIGGADASSGARVAWNAYMAHRRFESLTASSTIQKLREAARDYRTNKPEAPSELIVRVDTDGIKQVAVNLNEPGLIDSTELSTGELVKKTKAHTSRRSQPPFGLLK